MQYRFYFLGPDCRICTASRGFEAETDADALGTAKLLFRSAPIPHHDRAGTDTFPMTQEFLAMMIGVRRPGVTLAAQAFEADGLITYNHGMLTIVDRAGLETASCDCYAFIQSEFKRLLGRNAAR